MSPVGRPNLSRDPAQLEPGGAQYEPTGRLTAMSRDPSIDPSTNRAELSTGSLRSTSSR